MPDETPRHRVTQYILSKEIPNPQGSGSDVAWSRTIPAKDMDMDSLKAMIRNLGANTLERTAIVDGKRRTEWYNFAAKAWYHGMWRVDETGRKPGRDCYILSPALTPGSPLSLYKLLDRTVLEASGAFVAVRVTLPDNITDLVPDDDGIITTSVPGANVKVVLACRKPHARNGETPLLVGDCSPMPMVLRNGSWQPYPELLQEKCMPIFWPKLLTDFHGLKIAPNGFLSADEEKELAGYAAQAAGTDPSAKAVADWCKAQAWD